MVPPTRRNLLRTAAALTAGLAGCGRFTGEESSVSRSASDGPGPSTRGENSETDPDSLLLRTDAAEPSIRLAGADGTPAGSDRQSRYHTHTVVDSESRAENLVVADGADATAVSSFISATDFENETIYLETVRVAECFRLELCSVSWAVDEVQTNYVRRGRPYDERCAADAEVFESRLVRIPASLAESEVNGYGSSISGRGSCHGDGPAGAEGADGGSTEDAANATDGGTER
jgi:hypothetical protein